MADENENVEAGSETSGDEAAAETSQETTAAAETADASEEKSDETAADAGGATDTGTEPSNTDASETGAGETEQVVVDGSRTGFVENGRPGGECVCPDGRKGTIHSFDAGLVCIPNENQGD